MLLFFADCGETYKKALSSLSFVMFAELDIAFSHCWTEVWGK
jgi:hypothetical protein